MCKSNFPAGEKATLPDEDKYTKYGKNDDKKRLLLASYLFGDPMLVSNLDNLKQALPKKVPMEVFHYACFVLVSGVAFALLGGDAKGLAPSSFECMQLQLEVIGLFMVIRKIASRNSVSGISGSTVMMMALVYCYRAVRSLEWSLYGNLLLESCTVYLVINILRSIFFPPLRKTYNEDLDVLKAWHLIPVCCVLAGLEKFLMGKGCDLKEFGFMCFTYIDALSLMPQVVMMSRSGGKVDAPIARFVACTAISRCGDMFHSLFIYHLSAGNDLNNWDCFRLWLSGDLDEGSNSAVLCWLLGIIVQLVQLALVVDFLYYFLQARAWANKASEEVELFASEV